MKVLWSICSALNRIAVCIDANTAELKMSREQAAEAHADLMRASRASLFVQEQAVEIHTMQALRQSTPRSIS
jgi:hypothetical protein